jgi:hypothetical protein
MKIFIPEGWEAGMYSLVVTADSENGNDPAWKEWRGILVVKPAGVEAKTICGAQAVPATQRPVEVPPKPRVDFHQSSAYSLCIVIDPLANPSVVRYRLMQRLDPSSQQEKDQVLVFHVQQRAWRHAASNSREPLCIVPRFHWCLSSKQAGTPGGVRKTDNSSDQNTRTAHRQTNIPSSV